MPKKKPMSIMNKYKFWTGSKMLTEGFFINSDGTVWAWVDYRMTDSFVLKGKLLSFTGLVSNGIEIYEGDWCRAEFRTKEGIQIIQGHIIMDDFMWCIDCTGSVGDDIFSINRPYNFEVIGNIYENPELLGSLGNL